MDIFKINIKLAIVMYIILDTVLVAIGMGVPFFCILFGFPVGWYLAKRLTLSQKNLKDVNRDILKYSFYTTLVTFLWMLVIWAPSSTMLMNPTVNFANWGIPMILYDPKISFIGWLILMVFISPFLQMLTTVFTAQVTLWRLNKNSKG